VTKTRRHRYATWCTPTVWARTTRRGTGMIEMGILTWLRARALDLVGVHCWSTASDLKQQSGHPAHVVGGICRTAAIAAVW